MQIKKKYTYKCDDINRRHKSEIIGTKIFLKNEISNCNLVEYPQAS